MHLDPVLELSLRCAFLALFAGSLLHKIANFSRFAATVASYVRNSVLAKDGVVLAFSIATAMGEAAVVIACIASASGMQRALAISGMLLLYAAAMAINLWRGNTLLDCGCSWGSERQPVGYALVVRNLVLALAAFILMLPASTRPLQLIDVVTVLAGTSVAALIYASANRLIASTALASRSS